MLSNNKILNKDTSINFTSNSSNINNLSTSTATAKNFLMAQTTKMINNNKESKEVRESTKDKSKGSLIQSNIGGNINVVIQKKDNSIDKLIKYIPINQSNQNSQINQNFSYSSSSQQKTSHLQSTQNNNILNISQSNNENATNDKIPSLKNLAKSIDKKYGVKDVKINLIGQGNLGSSKIKIPSNINNQPYAQNGNGNYTNGGQEVKYNHVQEYVGYSNSNNTPVVISHSSLIDKEKDRVDLKNLLLEGNQIPGSGSSASPIKPKMKIKHGSISINTNQTHTPTQANNQNINNTNSNLNSNNTSNNNINNIYDELSKKLIKSNAGAYKKVNSMSEEVIEPISSVVITEERSSRKKPNQTILEAENPEDLHFIQVEMQLQSKQISKKFENEKEKSPKIMINRKSDYEKGFDYDLNSVIQVEEVEM
jgi:hypothetical protein